MTYKDVRCVIAAFICLLLIQAGASASEPVVCHVADSPVSISTDHSYIISIHSEIYGQNCDLQECSFVFPGLTQTSVVGISITKESILKNFITVQSNRIISKHFRPPRA